MSTIPHVHPAWCHPLLCVTETDGINHRSAPAAWSVVDHHVTVGRSRYDHILASGEQLVDRDCVHIHVEHEACLSPAGDVVAVDLHLRADDARVLAAAILDATARITADVVHR